MPVLPVRNYTTDIGISVRLVINRHGRNPVSVWVIDCLFNCANIMLEETTKLLLKVGPSHIYGAQYGKGEGETGCQGRKNL